MSNHRDLSGKKKDHSPSMYHYRDMNPQRVRHLVINMYAGAPSSDQNYVDQGYRPFEIFQGQTPITYRYRDIDI